MCPISGQKRKILKNQALCNFRQTCPQSYPHKMCRTLWNETVPRTVRARVAAHASGWVHFAPFMQAVTARLRFVLHSDLPAKAQHVTFCTSSSFRAVTTFCGRKHPLRLIQGAFFAAVHHTPGRRLADLSLAHRIHRGPGLDHRTPIVPARPTCPAADAVERSHPRLPERQG